MTFVSYSQNLEDVMLYRALKQVERGFYIDVGASDPVVASVTKAFHDRGWRGINVEPDQKYFASLVAGRPEDINVNEVVCNRTGTATFYDGFPGLSSIKKDYADFHRTTLGYQYTDRVATCATLDDICGRYGVRLVHFLKIDAEGAEKEILEGFSFQSVRPWIVVIEANAPFSTRDISNEWEPSILGKNYEMAYYDGLNRFYVAQERSQLCERLRVPPNVFDDYITYDLAKERQEREQVEARLQKICSSYSWRLTSPLRKGVGGFFSLLGLAKRKG